MPDRPKRDKALTDRLDELESLLDEEALPADRPVIPILDELVNPADHEEDAGEDGEPGEAERIEDIALRLEQKLSAELDEIVNILKGNLKESIRSELHDRGKKAPGDKS